LLVFRGNQQVILEGWDHMRLPAATSSCTVVVVVGLQLLEALVHQPFLVLGGMEHLDQQ